MVRVMAQRKMIETICDRCGSTKDVERRQVSLPALRRQFSFDSCAECRSSIPLSEWEKLMPSSPRGATGSMVVSEAVVKKAARGRPRVSR